MSRQQFLACQPRLSSENLDVRRHQNLTAFAFGEPRPVKHGQYSDLDLVPWFLTDEFAPQLGLKTAVNAILQCWDLWIDGVRLADHVKGYGCLFAIGKRETAGRGPLLFVSGGAAEDIQADYKKLPDDEKPPSAHSVDMWAALQAMRADAERAGVALSDPLVPWDDPLWTKIIKQGYAIRLERMRLHRGWKPRPPSKLPPSLERLIDRVMKNVN